MGTWLILINNFIWNRLEDTLAYLNPSDLHPEKRISSDSRPLRNVALATYQLPIGRGRKVNLQSRWLDSLVGGWQLSNVFTLQSGPVLTWGNYIYTGGPLRSTQSRPGPMDWHSIPRSSTRSRRSSLHIMNVQTFDLQYNWRNLHERDRYRRWIRTSGSASGGMCADPVRGVQSSEPGDFRGAEYGSD